MNDEIERYFWSRVEKSESCWRWTGIKTKMGYGYLYIRGEKSMRAHRVSYQIHYGEFDSNLLVCHHCDTPYCVRPDHLFLGTCRDNLDDMRRKGRMRLSGRGEKKMSCILPSLVSIRMRIEMTQRRLAERVAVHPVTLSLIEGGNRGASLDLAVRIADALGVTVDDLLRAPEAEKGAA